MESLNMNTLVKSLPSSSVAGAEQDLLEKFKAAAMSITTLYKSSLSTNKRHYNAGYVTALEDLLDVIQQGVSEPGAGADGHSLTIGRIMDWIDARREAIRTREEEEDEEEQRENRNKSSASSSVAGPSIKQTPAPAVQTAHNSVNDARDKEREKRKAVVGGPPIQGSSSSTTHRLPDEQGQLSRLRSIPQQSVSSPPSPPLSSRVITRSSRHRVSKDIRQLSTEPLANSTPPLNKIRLSNSPESSPRLQHEADIVSSASSISSSIIGTKRRHALMFDSASPVSIDSFVPPEVIIPPSSLTGGIVLPSSMSSVNTGGSLGGTPRRRVRNTRSGAFSRVENISSGNQNSDAMDIEDEGGRERKRVARR